MGKRLSRLWGVCLLVGCIGVGMLIQAKVQCLTLEEAAEEVSLVRDLTRASADCAAALTRTTNERNRLLEHLADVESSVGVDCIPVVIWSCPVVESRDGTSNCLPVMAWACPVREVQP